MIVFSSNINISLNRKSFLFIWIKYDRINVLKFCINPRTRSSLITSNIRIFLVAFLELYIYLNKRDKAEIYWLKKAYRDNQLRDKTAAISYRESKITHLFKNFFEGTGKVRMIICLNPRPEDFGENQVNSLPHLIFLPYHSQFH